MIESVQIAVFEGGQLAVHTTGEKSREAVLALPLNRLLVKMVRIPSENLDNPAAFATPLMQALSPYPDEPLTVSCETVDKTPEGLVVLAAALPESAADDIAAILDERKLNVTRIDALALGRLRMLWGRLNDPEITKSRNNEISDDQSQNEKSKKRKIILLESVDCISLFVLDGDLPCAVRAVSFESDLKREVMLSLLEAEDFGGAKPLAEIVVVSGRGESSAGRGDAEITKLRNDEISLDQLSFFAPVRFLDVPDESIEGVAERSLDPFTLNALPASWRDVLEETRFKAKLKKFLIISGGIWALVMATLFGVPIVYDFMTDHQKTLSKEHARRYREVKDMREKVRLVQKYSDHARGALEILKAVSDRLPEGVELNSWNFRREEGVRFSGESSDAASVYKLKDLLLETKLKNDEGEETPLFVAVELTGPSSGRGGKQRFDIDCKFEAEESE